MRRFEPIVASERGDYEVQTSKSKQSMPRIERLTRFMIPVLGFFTKAAPFQRDACATSAKPIMPQRRLSNADKK
jgi:hypothetical protein